MLSVCLWTLLFYPDLKQNFTVSSLLEINEFVLKQCTQLFFVTDLVILCMHLQTETLEHYLLLYFFNSFLFFFTFASLMCSVFVRNFHDNWVVKDVVDNLLDW